jgi:predicted regulator of Ras-like GTPase activity (Roadblock/LC7/MglB family)
MEVILEQINKVQGVLGCLICDQSGKLLCRALPSFYDNKELEAATDLITDSLIGINEATGGTNMLDLRFANARMIVKSLQGGYLLLVCEQKINLQLFNMSLSVAQKKLEKAIQVSRDSPPSSQLSVSQVIAPQQTATNTPARDGNGVILVVDSMTASSKIQWDQMKEEAAISELLARHLAELSFPSPIKKLKLTSKATNKSKVVPVRVIMSEPGQSVGDKIALTLAANEALKARPGDVVVAEAVTGSVFTKDIYFAGL